MAYTKTPLVAYQNYLRELWFTTVVDLPKLTTDASKQRPLKEFIIKFTVKDGNTPLSFDFKTFLQTTGLDYNNRHYEAIPLMEVIKVELLKLGLHNDKQVEESAKPDNQPLIQTYEDFHMLMEDYDDKLNELSDDDIFEAGQDIDDPFPLPVDEETQSSPSTKQPSTES
nr:hypothetical protein [Tanacetum cinerariifolium]